MKKAEIENFPTNKGFNPHGVYFEESSKLLYVISHPFSGYND